MKQGIALCGERIIERLRITNYELRITIYDLPKHRTMEANMQVLEGAQYRLRVKLTNAAGETLPPELFRVYAGAFCPRCAPAHFHAERTPEEWVLTMPALKPGRVPWSWQVIAAEYATGVEWLLAAGEITVTPRYAEGSGFVEPGELKIVATLDKTTLQMTVQVGESTAACSLAVVDARNSAKAADASAQLAAGSASYAAEQAQAAETARKQADSSATNAAASAADAHGQATAADASASAAAHSASAAAASEELASEHATEAAGCSKDAAASAQDALANKQEAEQAAQDAAQAQAGAEQAKADADAASKNAAQKATEATESANQATADKTAAEKAKQDAQAAQSSAEVQAAIATAAAEAAQAPESIAVQAARPAVMVLLRQELAALLGDSAAWVVDTDGEKVVVHTDRLAGEQLAAVEDMLERFVPGFIGLRRHNHDFSIPWREIPDGFTVLDYIEGDGYQRVADVPIDGDVNDRLEVVFANYKQVKEIHNLYRLNYVVTPAMAEMGVKSCNFSDEVHFGVLGANCRPTMDYTWENNSFFRASDGSWYVNIYSEEGQKYELAVDAKKVYLDGVLKGQFDKKNEYPYVKFASMRLMNNMVARFYSARFVDNSTGEVQANMIPCLDSTGAPCLVNRVTGEAFYSVGSTDFLYPGKETEASTFSLRRPVMYGQLTAHGVRRLYHVPQGYNGTREEYAAEFGFKPLVETVEPEPVDGVVWAPHWRETEDELVLEWGSEEVNG